MSQVRLLQILPLQPTVYVRHLRILLVRLHTLRALLSRALRVPPFMLPGQIVQSDGFVSPFARVHGPRMGLSYAGEVQG